MSYPVTYYCPHCGTLVELERDGYLADKSVTPYPLEGWTYVDPTEPFEGDDADGVRFVCGESDGVDWDPHDGVRGPDVSETSDEGETSGEPRDAPSCGEPFLPLLRALRGGPRDRPARRVGTGGDRPRSTSERAARTEWSAGA